MEQTTQGVGMHAAGTKVRAPAIDGWFTFDGEPRLLGSRCQACGTFMFPPAALGCPNPACGSSDLETVPLSNRGTVWSYTDNRYAPPPPYKSPDPFVPYAVAAVELVDEKLVVLGMVDGDASTLEVGQEMELVIARLFEDDDHEYVVWKWRRAGSRNDKDQG
jgi:uncharacterized OB-fold protein